MKFCIDLCSGLGGFSQAFVDAGWEVIRIDHDEKFKNIPFTVIADVCDLEKIKDIVGEREVDIIVASPPCERFCLGPQWPKHGIGKALEIVGCCLELIVYFRPKHWVLENPKGRLRWFLSKPKTTIMQRDYGNTLPKPTDLWGNICLPLIPYSVPPSKGHGWKERRRLGVPVLSSDSAKNAVITYGLSKAILQSCIETWHD